VNETKKRKYEKGGRGNHAFRERGPLSGELKKKGRLALRRTEALPFGENSSKKPCRIIRRTGFFLKHFKVEEFRVRKIDLGTSKPPEFWGAANRGKLPTTKHKIIFIQEDDLIRGRGVLVENIF